MNMNHNSKSKMMVTEVIALCLAGIALLGGCVRTKTVAEFSAHPGQDLDEIRNEIRRWRSQDASRRDLPVRVVLSAGRYQLGHPIRLTAEDSNVEWTAKPDADVVIAGGVLVDASPTTVKDNSLLERMPERAREHVVQYDLKPLGISDFGEYVYNHEGQVQVRIAREWWKGKSPHDIEMGTFVPPDDCTSAGHMELFVDGLPYKVAQSRKGETYHINETNWVTVGSIRMLEPIPPEWTKEPDPYLLGCWQHDWAEQHQRVLSFDVANRRLELSKPYHQYGYKYTGYFTAFNMLCELDEPGEWYLDRDSGRLLVWLKDGEEGTAERRVELSMAERLFELSGASDIVFRGLTFETCRNSALTMKDCERCRIDGCTVRNVGQHALIVEDGHSCGARECTFFGMGGGGVYLVDGNRKTLEESRHYVENCDIHHFGRFYRMYRPAVFLSGVGMRVVGNRIHDSPHAAVVYYGCEHLLASNDVSRVCNDSNDCGVFYSGQSWLHRGNRIIGNHFHDIIGRGGQYTRTIYIDDGSAQYEVSGNLFERCTWAVFLGGGRENVITNNVFIDCPSALYVDNRGCGWMKPYIEERLSEIREKGTLQGIPLKSGVYAERYPAVRDLPGKDPYSPVLNIIAHNKFIRGKAEWIEKYGFPALRKSERWWRSGLSDEKLAELGVFEDNQVDNEGL